MQQSFLCSETLQVRVTSSPTDPVTSSQLTLISDHITHNNKNLFKRFLISLENLTHILGEVYSLTFISLTDSSKSPNQNEQLHSVYSIHGCDSTVEKKYICFRNET